MRHSRRPAALLLALALAAGPSLAADAPTCDLLFAGGRVVDGTGAPWFRADVCVVGDRIARVGWMPEARARRRVDASRLVVAPGFIDMMGQSEYSLLVDGRAASKITQGITTEITGEGSSIAPQNARMLEAGRAAYAYYGYTPTFTTLAGYFRELERRGTAVNLGTFVGAGGVRDLVIGQENRAPTTAELEAMKAAVAQAMEEGALGLSSALIYVPGLFASTDELVALARVAARYGGSYITHQRDEGDDGVVGLDASLDEVFRIAREAQIPAEIYHLKASGRRAWGRMPELLRRIEKARAEGLDVSADQYPWAASSNSLDASLPVWVREGGAERMVARLTDPATRARARADFLALPENADWPAGADAHPRDQRPQPRAQGVRGPDPRADREGAGRGSRRRAHRRRGGRPRQHGAGDVRHERGGRARGAAAPARVVLHGLRGAGRGRRPVEAEVHPRAFGSAARILGHYVRDEKVLGLEEAVRKMTSLPASRMRLQDRGLLRAGMAADVVAFDPTTVRARATYADPMHYSEGIPYVAVNGRLVVDEGRITEARPGRVLRGPGYRGAASR